MNKSIIIRSILFVTGMSCSLLSFAQRDTTKKQTIDITSSYKPVLRNAVKVNFSATQLNADTSKNVGPYNIPPQNLFYSYQPVSLRPLAIAQDSLLNLGTRNYVKAGFGNYTTPYLSAGFSFGDGKTSLVNVYADYVSSKGAIQNQDYSELNIKGGGSYFTADNEIYGRASVRVQDNYLYGYDHAVHNYAKADVLQRFQTLSLSGGIRNKAETGTGINYNPHVEVNLFSNENKAKESSLVLTVPASKTFAESFTVKVAAKADITSYTSKNLQPNVKFTNNIYSIAPELVYAKPLFNIHAGVTPTWENNKLSVFPNIYGEAKIQDKIFLVQAGLTGRFIKNTYQYLTSVNPFLQTLSFQQNTKEIELYGGLKATIGSHFNFSAKASWLTYSNLPLFVNDTADGKTFVVRNESRLYNFRIHGDMSFVKQDKFTVTGGLTFNGYNGMKDNDRAWGTIPLELNASLRWWAFKQVLLKGDFMAFSGGAFLMKDGSDVKLGGGTDLSAGVEFAINKRFSAWIDINNIFNNKYQRWYSYPVYGLNVLGGAIFRF
ncbi:MAG TPA: hypothetical protein PLY34_06260 [Ferruginibacter sp.]|nr:hypothetical protein [Ferruginibacter sp.]HPH89527.1 hypothetical protein [Ferruginibacter sp.]